MRNQTGRGKEFHRTFRRLIEAARGSPWLLIGLGGLLALVWISTLILKHTTYILTQLTTTAKTLATKSLSKILNFFSTNTLNYTTTLHHIFHIKLLHLTYLLLLLLLPLLYKTLQTLLHHLYFSN